MTSVVRETRPFVHRFLAYHFDGVSDLPVEFDTAAEARDTNGCCRVISNLRELGVSEEAIHILNLVPIIHVVWADIPPRAEQVQDVLNNAQAAGIRPGMVAWKLLELWLDGRPDASLFRIWNDYVGGLRWAMSADWFEGLKLLSISRSESTAELMCPGFGLLPKTGPHDFAARQIAAAFEQ